MKRRLLTLLVAMVGLTAGAWAQTPKLNPTHYDANGDGEVTIADVTMVVNAVLGRVQRPVTGIDVDEDFRQLTLTLGDTDMLDADGNFSVPAAPVPDDADYGDVEWTSSDPSVVTVSPAVYEGVTYTNVGFVHPVAAGTATLTIRSLEPGSTVATTIAVTVIDPSAPVPMVDGHEYVDLGLPSGILWATTNIGATSPEQYGLYFQWGMTTGYAKGAGHDFDWHEYAYAEEDMEHYNPDGFDMFLTKYCPDSGWGLNGFTDGLTELETADDAACQNWSTNWRMPSSEQVDELFDDDYTTRTWTTRNQVPGLLVTSRAYPARSIFLPAAGNYIGTNLYDEGEEVKTWTRTLFVEGGDDSSSAKGQHLAGKDGLAWTSATDRWSGMPVRPVTKIE